MTYSEIDNVLSVILATGEANEEIAREALKLCDRWACGNITRQSFLSIPWRKLWDGCTDYLEIVTLAQCAVRVQ